MTGAELREARKAAGVTQAWLARQLEVSVGTVSAWETGRRKIRNGWLAGLRAALTVGRRKA